MLHREDVIWAYRVILGRDPESEQVIAEKVGACPDMMILRDSLLASQEYMQSTTPKGKTEVVYEDNDGDRFFLDLNDHAISRRIMAGQYEPEVLACIRQLIWSGAGLCIDVGANIGFYSIKMASMGAPVVAFEPVKYLYNKLSRACTENCSRSASPFDVHSYQLAIGAKESKAMMVYAPATINHGGAYMMPIGSEVPPNHTSEEVKVDTLDNAFFNHGWFGSALPVRLIKMDVEGAEPLVVTGGTKLLAYYKPAIIAEIHRPQYARVSNTTPEEFLSSLHVLGYRHTQILDAGPTNPGRLPDYCNILVTA